MLLKERVKQRSRPAAALEKVPSFRARQIDPRNKNNTKIKVGNKSLKSESMSVLESDTNERIVSEKVLKYASNPEMSDPKEENSSISLLYKPFKYKTFLASRYSLELENEN